MGVGVRVYLLGKDIFVREGFIIWEGGCYVDVGDVVEDVILGDLFLGYRSFWIINVNRVRKFVLRWG